MSDVRCFVTTVEKWPGEPNPNEDAFARRQTSAVYALSDGASESYSAHTWSRLLVNAFCYLPEVDLGWLKRIRRLYSANFDVKTLPWNKLAAYERGSYATLLGLQIFGDWSYARVTLVGDSLLVLLRGEEIVRTLPYTSSEEFDQQPALLAARHSSEDEDAAFLGNNCWRNELLLEEDGITGLLCLTDALGKWLLEDRTRIDVLRSIRTKSALRALVEAERESRRMRTDDCTLMLLEPRRHALPGS